MTRRYSEFQWLHDALIVSCLGVIVPPLPKKEFFGRFDDHFVQSRIRGLEAFLQRVTRHPILSQQIFVKSFLEDQDITIAQRNFKILQEQSKMPSKNFSKWLQTKFGEISVSKQEVCVSIPPLMFFADSDFFMRNRQCRRPPRTYS